jgi:DNA helicase-2/ATP-dependent DNA helicase PcrA
MPTRWSALHRAYESVKDERRQLDFEDVLLATAGMIEAEPRVAQQVREQYRFFVVDEYQDVSPLQQALLELWLGDRQDLCVVGDASQTIYSFAGASADFLLGFPTRFREAAVVRLEQNYRSSPPIVGMANQLMRGRPGALALRASPGAPEAAAKAAPTVTAYPSEVAEARAVAGQIATDAGVSFQLRGGTRFFEQQEVKQALMMLKGAVVGATREPLFKTVSDVLRSLGWTQDAPEVRGAVRDRWESLNALMGLAEASAAGTSLPSFVAELFERAATQHEPTKAAVTLATLHSAKGLEWDTVFLVGLSDGYVPITYAKTEQSVDEERRLLYVGITRARRRLHLSWAGGSSGRGPERRASRFLLGLA